MAAKPETIPSVEGHLVEFKCFSGGISVKELSVTLCAFANSEGGSIYVGVTDSGQPTGLKVTPTVLDKVQNAAREGCTPPVPIKLTQIAVGPSRHVLKISAAKTAQLHSVAAGQSYIRVGTQDKRVLGDELLRLAETKSQVSFEEQLLDAGIEVIDSAALEEYYQARRDVSAIASHLQPEQLLVRLGLAQRTKTTFRIKAGAFVLFGNEQEDLMLQREFTFVRYEQAGQMYTYREDVCLPAAKAIQRLVELIRPHNQQTPQIKGIKRHEMFRYPEEAIREALLNALAHRDYRLAGLKNECRLYPDRIEFISAGGLPGFVTLETLGTRHYSRNPKTMHALLILGLVEELGQGIALMKNSLAKNNNPPPEFRATSDQVTVIFRAPVQRIPAKRVEEVLDRHFRNHDFVTRRQLEGLLGLRSTAAKMAIAKLVRSGYLRRLGAARSTRYEKKT